MGWIAVTGAVVVLFAGCGAARPAAASLRSGPVSQWAEEVARVVQQGVPEGRVIAGSARQVEAPAGSRITDLDRLLQSAPTSTDADIVQLRQVLAARRAASTLAGAAIASDQRAGAVVDATAARSTSYRDVRTELGVIGRDIVKDIACNALLDRLQPTEKSEAEDAGEPTWVQFVEPTAQAIVNATARRLSAGAASPVAWSTWGYGIGKDADDIVQAADATTATPGAARSGAFYHYVRICLKPPS